MDDELKQVIDDSIRLENKAEEIYHAYARRFPEDIDFWTQMAYEEHCHAELVKSKWQEMDKGKPFPHDMICQRVEKLKASNAFAKIILASVDFLSMEKALALAVLMEEGGGECDVNRFTCTHCENPLHLFNTLNEIDCDHAERIRKLIRSKGWDPKKIEDRLAYSFRT